MRVVPAAPKRDESGGPTVGRVVFGHPGKHVARLLEVTQESSVGKPIGDLPSRGHRLVGGHDPAKPCYVGAQLLSSQHQRHVVVLMINLRRPSTSHPPIR